MMNLQLVMKEYLFDSPMLVNNLTFRFTDMFGNLLNLTIIFINQHLTFLKKKKIKLKLVTMILVYKITIISNLIILNLIMIQ